MSLSKIDKNSFQIRSLNFDEIFIFEEEDMEELYSYWYEIIEKHWGDFIKKTPQKQLNIDDESRENFGTRQSWGKSNKIHSLSSLKGIDNDLIGKLEIPQSVVNQEYLIKMKRESPEKLKIIVSPETRIETEMNMSPLTAKTPSGTPPPSITPPKSPINQPISISVEKVKNQENKRRSVSFLNIKSIIGAKKK